MDAASWRGKRANSLTKGIVLILIATVAVGLLVSATLALVSPELMGLGLIRERPFGDD